MQRVQGAACALLLAGTQLQAADAWADLLRPFPAPTEAVTAVPIPLRPQETPARISAPAPRRAGQPARPSWTLHEGDRVLFLGDQLLLGELDYGHLETRLTTQFPDRTVTFRNLAWLSDHPLGRPRSDPELDWPESWLERLLERASQIRPTAVFLGFGTDAAAAGTAGLDSFRVNLESLIDGLLGAADYPPPRLVILSPLSRELADPTPDEAEFPEDPRVHYAQLLWEIAASRQSEFIDLYHWSQAEARRALELAESDPPAARALTRDGLRLSQYGYWRMTIAWERGLRWAHNHWRFGYLTDGTLRRGQFGIEVLDRDRSGRHATARTIEARLPTPNPPGIFEVNPESRPQCYIQITGLDPGVYALYVDGEFIQRATETDWARYQIISQGPSWDQAERLRQTIVRKHTLLRNRCPADNPPTSPRGSADPEVAELEAQIATLRQPIPRTYEVRRFQIEAPQVPAPRRPRVPPGP